LNYARRFREPQVRIELTTARLRIGCSTPELLWQVLRNGPSVASSAKWPFHGGAALKAPSHRTRYDKRHWHHLQMRSAFHALERTRTAMPYGTTPSRWRVYQFHHQGRIAAGCFLLAASS